MASIVTGQVLCVRVILWTKAALAVYLGAQGPESTDCSLHCSDSKMGAVLASAKEFSRRDVVFVTLLGIRHHHYRRQSRGEACLSTTNTVLACVPEYGDNEERSVHCKCYVKHPHVDGEVCGRLPAGSWDPSIHQLLPWERPAIITPSWPCRLCLSPSARRSAA